MKPLSLHHVGLITADLEKSVEFFRKVGYDASQVFSDAHQKARVVLMLQSSNKTMVELVSPLPSESLASQWLKRIQAGTYHLCYETPNLESSIEDFEVNGGFISVMKPVPAVAFENRRITFLWSRLTGLLELLEKSP